MSAHSGVPPWAATGVHRKGTGPALEQTLTAAWRQHAKNAVAAVRRRGRADRSAARETGHLLLSHLSNLVAGSAKGDDGTPSILSDVVRRDRSAPANGTARSKASSDTQVCTGVGYQLPARSLDLPCPLAGSDDGRCRYCPFAPVGAGHCGDRGV
uniref:Uncharacterized protein n=1 Tax=Plectus sambesii TaxID=2011161 RepID=A0A914VJG5_9BILA